MGFGGRNSLFVSGAFFFVANLGTQHAGNIIANIFVAKRAHKNDRLRRGAFCNASNYVFAHALHS